MSKYLVSVSAAALMLSTAVAQASGPETSRPPARLGQFYISGFAGYTWENAREFAFVSNTTNANFNYKVSHDRGNVFGGAAGVLLSKNARIEFEYARSKNDFSDDYVSSTFIGLNESGDVKLTTYMANLWYNTDLLFGFLSPYIGGGIGWGKAEGSLTVTNGAGRQFAGSENGFVFQVGGGVRIPIGNNFEFDLGARYKKMNDVNFASQIPGFRTTSDDVTVKSVQAGITFKF